MKGNIRKPLSDFLNCDLAESSKKIEYLKQQNEKLEQFIKHLEEFGDVDEMGRVGAYFGYNGKLPSKGMQRLYSDVRYIKREIDIAKQNLLECKQMNLQAMAVGGKLQVMNRRIGSDSDFPYVSQRRRRRSYRRRSYRRKSKTTKRSRGHK